MTKYEDVANQTTEEYFNGNQFSIDAFNKKYTAYKGETYVQALKRVCDNIASVEKTEELQKYWSERWFDEIYNDWWHPAGSIMEGAGANRNVSLANCTTISLGTVSKENEDWDNLESIFRNTAYTVAKCAAYRQGLGVDFSKLRPRGTSVTNSARESTGAIHWMKFIDSIGYYVGQKGRIPAMLFSISCKHPDLIEFIEAKKDYTVIQNANISVQITDDFYKAVENDDDWYMEFVVPEVEQGNKVYIDGVSATPEHTKGKDGFYSISKRKRYVNPVRKILKARKILELIAQRMFINAEPGIQNIDLARHLSNSDYVYDPDDEYDSRILSTNACSEQYLSRESLCVLASQNAGKFSIIKDEFEKQQERIAGSMNRFLDNVNESELQYGTYATYHQKLAIQKLRRTGAGFTNLSAWLFKQNLPYGTKEAVEATKYFTERFNYHLYLNSIQLGEEKGSFGLFNRGKLEKSPFIRHMMDLGLDFAHLRNVTCSSIAPTGTLSLMFREEVMSYGAEPGFGIYYWKRTRISGKYEYYFCVPSVVREFFAHHGFPIPMESDSLKDTWDGKHGKLIAAFIDENKDKIGLRFKTATQVSPFEKLDMMSVMMQNIDSSISITYLLPENTNWKDVYDFILAARKKGVKSLAAFPDRQMYGIVSFEPFKELARRLIKQDVKIHNQNFTTEELKQLGEENIEQENSIVETNAPKRPKVLPCDVYFPSINKEKYVVCVGLLNGKPYETFACKLEDLDGPVATISDGIIEKFNRGHYRLKDKEGSVVLNDVGKLMDANEQALTRLISASLRHGAGIQFLIDQLEKIEGPIHSFIKAISRCLKKYISQGIKVTGMACGSCGQENSLVRQDGCVQCSCGWSKC